MPKTWFITGATRGIGRAIATAALGAGDRVVATGRDPDATRAAFPNAGAGLGVVALDVTDPRSIEQAVAHALGAFGTIDVLVNNAGYGQFGLFEELSREEAAAQFATNVTGVMDVTRAVLPAMRRRRSGRVFNISSIGGMIGGVGYSLYCASKFALEGFSESLAAELAGFGISVTVVQPGFFRTDFLAPSSIRYADASIDDYADLRTSMRTTYEAYDRKQAGDPAKLAAAIVRLAGEAKPPLRFAVGSDAYAVLSDKIDALRGDLETWRELTVSTNHEVRG